MGFSWRTFNCWIYRGLARSYGLFIIADVVLVNHCWIIMYWFDFLKFIINKERSITCHHNIKMSDQFLTRKAPDFFWK